MTTLIKIKQQLTQTVVGRFTIKVYHYMVAKPLAKVYSYKYYLIKNKIKHIRFYSDKETFNMIKLEKKSLCRFGDGEISWIYRDSKGYFSQENSKELSDRLRNIILSDNKNILVGIPNFFGSLDQYSKKRRQSRNTHLAKYYKRWMELLDSKRVYADALITRVYHGLKDNRSRYMFDNWKSVWNDKNVIVIEGSQTRFGVGNDLLANVRSVRRIIAPAENAFQRYDEILSISKEFISEDTMFIISLGPTATVLAYDIGIYGSQAIDIGHLDIEYEWYLSGATKKKPVIGKYVNEAGGPPNFEMPETLLEVYKSEIIKYVV
ncbi:GT-D fold domain-containing glycosyltransferase [Paenibacillus sp. sgz302251]|uniref:GT-D fold domain-containing glycosyltransferase n=1 Tax=Paenibacillus sp. sgz302251 TaxID=3414493 RepID=UPI003C7D3ED2